jgi:hypothetical protein
MWCQYRSGFPGSGASEALHCPSMPHCLNAAKPQAMGRRTQMAVAPKGIQNAAALLRISAHRNEKEECKGSTHVASNHFCGAQSCSSIGRVVVAVVGKFRDFYQPRCLPQPLLKAAGECSNQNQTGICLNRDTGRFKAMPAWAVLARPSARRPPCITQFTATHGCLLFAPPAPVLLSKPPCPSASCSTPPPDPPTHPCWQGAAGSLPGRGRARRQTPRPGSHPAAARPTAHQSACARNTRPTAQDWPGRDQPKWGSALSQTSVHMRGWLHHLRCTNRPVAASSKPWRQQSTQTQQKPCPTMPALTLAPSIEQMARKWHCTPAE